MLTKNANRMPTLITCSQVSSLSLGSRVSLGSIVFPLFLLDAISRSRNTTIQGKKHLVI